MFTIELKKNRHLLYPWLLLLFICIITVADIFLSSKSTLGLSFIAQKMILASNSRGHVAAILLFWVFPLYAFLLFAERFIKERTSNAFLVEQIRTPKKKGLLTKCITNASLLTSFFALGFLVNSLIVLLLIPKPTAVFDQRYAEMLEVFTSWEKVGTWIYAHTNITYMIYVLFACIIFFLMSLLIGLLALVFPNRKVVYSFAMIYWLIWWFIPYDLSMAIQPFTEYGLSYAIVALLIFTIPTILIIYLLIRRYATNDYL
ncbi:MAG: hypothetical protein KBH56_00910 [Enterococcus sp.]|nr:hypothetical protein [Enterococcus sp.]MBP8692703.1 hypothetical protein [Enterococcus sp.]